MRRAEEEGLSERSEDRRSAHESSDDSTAFSRSDRYALGVLALLVVGVILLMAARDLNGPLVEACVTDGGDSVLPKHIHCVSRNGTKSFSAFLDAQGAKKEHPFYAAERSRLRGDRARRSHGGHNANATRLRAGSAAARATHALPDGEGDDGFRDPRVDAVADPGARR